MSIFTDPWFWALVSMSGLLGCAAVVGTDKIGRYSLFGLCLICVFELGRFLLVLPFCLQLRFDLGGTHQAIGGILFIVGLIFGLVPAFQIRPLTSADENINLITTVFYGIVKNPIHSSS